MKHLQKWLLIIVIVWGLVPNVYLTYRFICGDCLPIVAQFNHIAHFVLLSGIIGLVATIVLRGNKQQLAWFFPCIIIFGLWFGGNWLPKSTPDVEGIEIKVATYNVQGNVSYPNEVMKVINQLDADIIGLEELRGELRQRVQNELLESYPYQVTEEVAIGTGLGILSRYPIVDYDAQIKLYDASDKMPLPSYIRAEIDISGRTIVVYVFHAMFPNYKLFSSYDDNGNLYQVQQITKQIEKESDPVILLCDCNSTPRTHQYRILNQVLNNSFDQRGFGFGLTYPSKYPIIRIDHIWISSHFETLKIKVWNNGGSSDHRPLWACLGLKE